MGGDTRPPRGRGADGLRLRSRAQSPTAMAPGTRSRPRSPTRSPRAGIRTRRSPWRPVRARPASPAGARTSGSSIRPLSDHLPRPLVVAQPEVAGVPQAAIARPFAEGELPDEARLDPIGALRHRMDVGEGRIGPLELPHPLAELGERALVEAGADLAGV